MAKALALLVAVAEAKFRGGQGECGAHGCDEDQVSSFVEVKKPSTAFVKGRKGPLAKTGGANVDSNKRGDMTMTKEQYEAAGGGKGFKPKTRYMIAKKDKEGNPLGLALHDKGAPDKKYAKHKKHMSGEHVSEVKISPFEGDEDKLVASKDDNDVRQWLAEAASEFKEVADTINEKANCGLFVYVELTLNVSCKTGLRSTMCQKDHDFEYVALVAHEAAPNVHLLRVTVPAYAVTEFEKFALMPAYDTSKDEAESPEEVEQHWPKLLYVRTGKNPGKRTRGRLYVQYETEGAELTLSDPQYQTPLRTFFHARDRSGCCATDDNPITPVNGCR